jgi:two-component system, OmpR family, KDP operon response regulator KdpE
MAERILVIDDDRLLLQLIERSLTVDGYEVVTAIDGQSGMRLLHQTEPHLVVLDVMMPNLDGWETCQRIREISSVPIIMLTARGGQDDIIKGLRAGADDYVVKPFHPGELQARAAAVLRRTRLPVPNGQTPLRFGGGELIIDPAKHQVFVNGDEADLTPTEYDLLLYMAERAGRILATEIIFDNVWSYDTEASLDSVKWYIWRLRKKIEESPGQPKFIITERGIGYRFAPN